MKKLSKFIWLYVIVAIVSLVLRVTNILDIAFYDMILKWLNFGILALLIVWFSRIPIKNFLSSQKEELLVEINRIESEKNQLEEKLQAAQNALKESQDRFSEIKSQIVNQGEKRRDQIIAEAQQKSAQMLDGARQKIDRMMTDAIASFRSDMVEVTMELVEKQLSQVVTEEDQQKYVDRYLSSLSAK